MSNGPQIPNGPQIRIPTTGPGQGDPRQSDPEYGEAMAEELKTSLKESMKKTAERKAAQAAQTREEEAPYSPPTGAEPDDDDGDNEDTKLSFDFLDYAGTAIDNRFVRMAMEKKLEPMSFDQIITEDGVSQEVPFGEHTFEFQTVTRRVQEHIHVISTNAAAEAAKAVPDPFKAAQANIEMQKFDVASHLKAYNGREMPSIVTADGKLDEAALDQRLKFVWARDEMVFELLECNVRWFLARVRKLTPNILEILGNG